MKNLLLQQVLTPKANKVCPRLIRPKVRKWGKSFYPFTKISVRRKVLLNRIQLCPQSVAANLKKDRLFWVPFAESTNCHFSWEVEQTSIVLWRASWKAVKFPAKKAWLVFLIILQFFSISETIGIDDSLKRPRPWVQYRRESERESADPDDDDKDPGASLGHSGFQRPDDGDVPGEKMQL